MKRLLPTLGITLLLAIASCGGDGDDNDQPGTAAPSPTPAPTVTVTPLPPRPTNTPVADVTGTFNGTAVLTVSSSTDSESTLVAVEMNVTQVNGNVTGTYGEAIIADLTFTDSGPISGTVNENRINMSIQLADGTSCSGYTVSGTLTLNGDRLTGRLSGTCGGLNITRDFDLIRG